MIERKFREWLQKQSIQTKGGTQKEVAERFGLSRSAVNRLLHNKRKGAIRLTTLEKMARARNWTVFELVYCIELGVSEPPPRVHHAPRVDPPPKAHRRPRLF